MTITILKDFKDASRKKRVMIMTLMSQMLLIFLIIDTCYPVVHFNEHDLFLFARNKISLEMFWARRIVLIVWTQV